MKFTNHTFNYNGTVHMALSIDHRKNNSSPWKSSLVVSLLICLTVVLAVADRALWGGFRSALLRYFLVHVLPGWYIVWSDKRLRAASPLLGAFARSECTNRISAVVVRREEEKRGESEMPVVFRRTLHHGEEDGKSASRLQDSSLAEDLAVEDFEMIVEVHQEEDRKCTE